MYSDFFEDIEIICELLNLTYQEFAKSIGVTEASIYGWKRNEVQINPGNLKSIYDFAFEKKIRLNKIKQQLFQEECEEGHKILFHGAKTYIDGMLSVEKSKAANDFGKGFYCGESMEQSAMFVSSYPNSSLYILDFNSANLNCARFAVDRDWMLAIAYHRGKLTGYENHPVIKKALDPLTGSDYVIAPIADNRMFEIIDSFIDGEITDVQCQHCLSATNLGNQYVFTSQKALDQVEILRHCYLAGEEKKSYLSIREEESRVGIDKVRIAKRTYRSQGNYIEDILT